MARFSSAVGKRPEGSTICEGTAGSSVVGSGPRDRIARRMTTTALATTTRVSSANTAWRTPLSVLL
jgi:hypothetical protein